MLRSPRLISYSGGIDCGTSVLLYLFLCNLKEEDMYGLYGKLIAQAGKRSEVVEILTRAAVPWADYPAATYMSLTKTLKTQLVSGFMKFGMMKRLMTDRSRTNG